MTTFAWNKSTEATTANTFVAASSALLLTGALSIMLGVFVSVAVVISSILIIVALARRLIRPGSEQSR